MDHTQIREEIIRLQKRRLTATLEFKLTEEYLELAEHIGELKGQLSLTEINSITEELDQWAKEGQK